MNAVESSAVNALDARLQVEELLVKFFLLFSLLISAYLILAGLVFEEIVFVCFFLEAVVADRIKVTLLRTPVGRYFVRLTLIFALIANLVVPLRTSFLHFINFVIIK